MKTFLLALALILAGCGMGPAAEHFFDEGVTHPVHTPWARAETARLATLHGTSPDITTRFLLLQPQGERGETEGWYDGFKISVCLLDEYGNEQPGRVIRNVWHHEWNHARHGDIRLDDHQDEYTRELIALGLWETR